MNSYDINDAIILTGTFKVGANNTDPTTVTLKVKDPAGTSTTYTYALGTVSKSATGVYTKTITVTAAGIWYYRFEGTGACQAAEESSFAVEASQF